MVQGYRKWGLSGTRFSISSKKVYFFLMLFRRPYTVSVGIFFVEFTPFFTILFCWLASEIKRWNLGFTLHLPPINKTRNLPPCYSPIFPDLPSHYPPTFPKLPTHYLPTSPTMPPHYSPTCPILPPHYTHTHFPPFWLTTLPTPNYPSSRPSQEQIDHCKLTTFFH